MASNGAGEPDPEVRRRTLLIAAALAVGIGCTAAAGSVFDGPGPDGSWADALPRAIVGALLGAVAIGAVMLVVRRSGTDLRTDVAASVVVVAACIGALAAVGMMPGGPDDLGDGDDGAPIADFAYRTRSGDVASGVVAPLDLDGDDRPDAIAGRPVLAYDADADGVEDGRLSRCEAELTVEIPTDSIAINSTCSAVVDILLPYDSTLVLTPQEDSAPAPPPERATERDTGDFSDLQGTIVLLIGLGGVLVALHFFANQVDLVPVAPDSLFLEGRDFLDDDEPDLAAVATAIERSIVALRSSGRPRDAILAAYATLLDELRTVGLARHPWEGPSEHCRRVLAEAQLPAGPIDALVDLFAVARFGNRTMMEADRDAARAALSESLDLLETTMGRTRVDAESLA